MYSVHEPMSSGPPTVSGYKSNERNGRSMGFGKMYTNLRSYAVGGTGEGERKRGGLGDPWLTIAPSPHRGVKRRLWG